MGYHKELWLQMQSDELGVQLAEILELPYEEFRYLEYEIENVNDDDGIIVGHLVKFKDNSPQKILNKIKRLQGKIVYLDSSELDIPDDEDDDDYFYYDEQFDAITSNKFHHESFLVEIANLNKLKTLNTVDSDQQNILYRLIFIGVFGAFETFLSDTFINLTFENDAFLKNFIESHPEFRKRKFELREIYNYKDKLGEIAKKVMLDTIYHDLPKIKAMYSMTFKIEFPDLVEIMKLVTIRHDLVHRNGKSKEGSTAIIDEAQLNKLIEVVTGFSNDLAIKLDLIQPEN